MRILHINSATGLPGGVETYLAPVTDALRRHGHEVAVVGNDLRAIEDFRPDVVQFHRIADPAFVTAVAVRFPTLVFAHDFFPYACPGDGRFLADKKTACTRAVGPFCLIAPWLQRCGSRRPLTHFARYAASALARRHAPRVLVASRFMKEELARNGVASDVVGLPVPGDLCPDVPPALSMADPPLILGVGRLVAHKGFDALLDAAARLRRPYRLEIIGEGPERPALERRAREYKLDVTFSPALTRGQIAGRYAASRVVAVPSHWPEPFGLVGLEAMAFARPTVAFDVGGVREWLHDGQTGYAVPHGDVDAFARRLEAVLAEPRLAATLGGNGRRVLEERFTLPKHLARLEVIYEATAGTMKSTHRTSQSLP